MKILPKLIIAFLCISANAPAQFSIGWTGGHTNLRELNREIYVYNTLNGSGLTKQMKEVHWCQGPIIGFRSSGNVYFEAYYNRKKTHTSSSFDSASIPMNRQMKVFSNTFNFGLGFRSNNWAIGGSMDFGRFKGFGRRGPESSIKDQKWQRLWVQDNTRIIGISVRLYFAATFYVERTIGIATIRLYTQPFAFKQPMDGLDHWLFGADLDYAQPNEERFGNTGIALFLNLGGK